MQIGPENAFTYQLRGPPVGNLIFTATIGTRIVTHASSVIEVHLLPHASSAKVEHGATG